MNDTDDLEQQLTERIKSSHLSLPLQNLLIYSVLAAGMVFGVFTFSSMLRDYPELPFFSNTMAVTCGVSLIGLLILAGIFFVSKSTVWGRVFAVITTAVPVALFFAIWLLVNTVSNFGKVTEEPIPLTVQEFEAWLTSGSLGQNLTAQTQSLIVQEFETLVAQKRFVTESDLQNLLSQHMPWDEIESYIDQRIIA